MAGMPGGIGMSPEALMQTALGGQQARQQAASGIAQAGASIGQVGAQVAQAGAQIEAEQLRAAAMVEAAKWQFASAGLSAVADMTTAGLGQWGNMAQVGVQQASLAASMAGDIMNTVGASELRRTMAQAMAGTGTPTTPPSGEPGTAVDALQRLDETQQQWEEATRRAYDILFGRR